MGLDSCRGAISRRIRFGKGCLSAFIQIGKPCYRPARCRYSGGCNQYHAKLLINCKQFFLRLTVSLVGLRVKDNNRQQIANFIL